MRTIALAILIAAACPAQETFGTWKMNPARSTFHGDGRPKSFTVRVQPRSKGEVFTVDITDVDGHATTTSTILYFDGERRVFQYDNCSGTQRSTRTDQGTVEISRDCQGGDWTRLVWRASQRPAERLLDITGVAGGRRLEHRLVLEKYLEAK